MNYRDPKQYFHTQKCSIAPSKAIKGPKKPIVSPNYSTLSFSLRISLFL
jgi:hypothetical protein